MKYLLCKDLHLDCVLILNVGNQEQFELKSCLPNMTLIKFNLGMWMATTVPTTLCYFRVVFQRLAPKSEKWTVNTSKDERLFINKTCLVLINKNYQESILRFVAVYLFCCSVAQNSKDLILGSQLAWISIGINEQQKTTGHQCSF